MHPTIVYALRALFGCSLLSVNLKNTQQSREHTLWDILPTEAAIYRLQGPFLQTLINFNPRMDKYSQTQ